MKSTIHENRKKTNLNLSKNLRNITVALAVTLALASCSKDDDSDFNTPEPSAVGKHCASGKHFKDAILAYMKDITQTFELSADDASRTFTSKKGVQFTINRADLSVAGNPVTGSVNIQFIEIFDGGTMLLANKPTMGIMADGKQSLLISGGEFFISATSDGKEVSLNGSINANIPADLTGGFEGGMLLWQGVIDKNDNLAWDKPRQGIKDGQGTAGGASYNANLGFGWTNVDKFYSDPRPKTTILAAVPNGHDADDSAVYLHYDGEGNALAKLDTYDPVTKLFSEHYGQIPVGLECHMIFVTEDAGQWRYAIKALTISAGATYTFTLAETTLGTKAQLEAAINALP